MIVSAIVSALCRWRHLRVLGTCQAVRIEHMNADELSDLAKDTSSPIFDEALSALVVLTGNSKRLVNAPRQIRKRCAPQLLHS